MPGNFKILGKILALSAFFGLLAACSPNDSDSESTDSEQAEAEILAASRRKAPFFRNGLGSEKLHFRIGGTGSRIINGRASYALYADQWLSPNLVDNGRQANDLFSMKLCDLNDEVSFELAGLLLEQAAEHEGAYVIQGDDLKPWLPQVGGHFFFSFNLPEWYHARSKLQARGLLEIARSTVLTVSMGRSGESTCHFNLESRPQPGSNKSRKSKSPTSTPQSQK